MLSDEEKKAIKDCDIIFISLEDMMSEEGANDYRKSYKILKNLIEKQSKEIEELKRKEQLIKTYKGNLPENVEFVCLCKNDFERNISDDYVSKDKIKEKIKWYEDFRGSILYEKYNYEEFIKDLQSLLKEE